MMMNTSTSSLEKFFGVIVRGQTYKNLLYLALAFPLGLFYFVFLVTGLSLGIGLTILFVGLFILGFVFFAWYALILFERQLATGLLGQQLGPVEPADRAGKTFWKRFSATLGDPLMWKGLAFLLLKFPLGIGAFTVLVTLLSLSLSLIAAPVYYNWIHPQVNFGWALNAWVVDTGFEAAMACLIGLLLVPVSLHIFNGVAWVFAWLSRVLLTNRLPAPVPAASPAPAELPATPATTPAPSTAPEPSESLEENRE